MFPIREQDPMKLLGRNKLLPLYGADKPTELWVRGWVSEMTLANWKLDGDLLKQFPRTQPSSLNDVYLFPVRDLPQQIEVKMIFSRALALVLDVKRAA